MATASLNVVHLTSAHPANDGRIFFKECRSLARAGHTVTLIATSGTAGVRDGVDVRIVGIDRSGRAQRMLTGVKRVRECAMKINADVYHLHDPELLRIAGSLSRNGAKIVYDAHEDLPRQILGKYWISESLREPASWAAERIENRIVRRLDAVVAASPEIRDRFARIHPETVLVRNYPDLVELSEIRSSVPNERSICYAGLITVERGIIELLNALPRMHAHLQLAGRMLPSVLLDRLRSMDAWERVEYHGILKRERALELMKGSAIGMLTYRPSPNHVCSLPTKLFEYLGLGLPVITSDFSYWAEIVEKYGCGRCVDPGDPLRLASTVNGLLSDDAKRSEMGARGRALVKERFNWSGENAMLLDLYRRLANGALKRH